MAGSSDDENSDGGGTSPGTSLSVTTTQHETVEPENDVSTEATADKSLQSVKRSIQAASVAAAAARENAARVAKKSWHFLLLFCQWVVWVVLAIFAAILVTATSHTLSTPNETQVPFWIGTALFAIIAMLHFPPLLFRVRGVGKAAYIALLPTVIGGTMCMSLASQAYDRTPEGIQAAALRNAQEASTSSASESPTESVSEEDASPSVGRCIGVFGKVGALVSMTKDKLKSPGSFNHMETYALPPSEAPYNIAMRFRAKDRSGDKHIVITKAVIYPESCEIGEMTRPGKFGLDSVWR